MTTTNVTEWLMRGHAAASIVFNDPAWAEQNYQMQRGERRRGDYDPPVPSQFVDALCDRQKRLNALEDLMLAQGRADDPPPQDRDAWAQPDADSILSRRLKVSGGIRWVPAALLAEFQALYATPLPSSADVIGQHR
jgi:hypothetical protein